MSSSRQYGPTIGVPIYGEPMERAPGRIGTKYGVPLKSEPVYRVTKENPIVDPEKNWTLDEVKDRLDQLITVLGSVPSGYERDIVQEEIDRLEKLIRAPR